MKTTTELLAAHSNLNLIGYDWALATDEAYEAAAKLAKGGYQLDFLGGYQAMSGGTLKGRAKSYGARYADSRRNLLDRLDAADIPWGEAIGANGRRVLVLGVSA